MKWWTSLSTPIRFGCVMAWPMLLFVAAPAAAPAQDVAKPAAGVQPGSAFGPGAIVVLKSAGAPLSDAGRLVPSQDCLVFLIERTQGDLILLASSDNSVRGWLHPDHVVPLDKAVGYFAEVIAGDRRNAEGAPDAAGGVRYYLNDDRRALVNLDQAIRLKPDQARFYLTRSLVYFRTDKIDRAMEDCDKAIQLETEVAAGLPVPGLRLAAQERSGPGQRRPRPGVALDPMNLVGPPGAVPAGDDAHDDDADGTGESTTPGGPAARPEPATACSSWTEETSGLPRKGSTGPWPIITRPSGSTPSTRRCSPPGPGPGRRSIIARRRLPIAARRSGSSPITRRTGSPGRVLVGPGAAPAPWPITPRPSGSSPTNPQSGSHAVSNGAGN